MRAAILYKQWLFEGGKNSKFPICAFAHFAFERLLSVSKVGRSKLGTRREPGVTVWKKMNSS